MRFGNQMRASGLCAYTCSVSGGQMRALFRVAATMTLTALSIAATYLSIEIYPAAQAQIEPAPGDTTPPTNGAQEPTVTVLDRRDVQSVLGKEVRSAANENMGRIVDVIVDRS